LEQLLWFAGIGDCFQISKLLLTLIKNKNSIPISVRRKKNGYEGKIVPKLRFSERSP